MHCSHCSKCLNIISNEFGPFKLRAFGPIRSDAFIRSFTANTVMNAVKRPRGLRGLFQLIKTELSAMYVVHWPVYSVGRMEHEDIWRQSSFNLTVTMSTCWETGILAHGQSRQLGWRLFPFTTLLSNSLSSDEHSDFIRFKSKRTVQDDLMTYQWYRYQCVRAWVPLLSDNFG